MKPLYTVCFLLLACGLVAAQEVALQEVSDPSTVLSLEPQLPELLMTLAEAQCLEGEWEYHVGGLEQGEASKKVWRRHQLRDEVQPLPDLPVPLAYASASIWSNYLCVVGGLSHARRYEFNYETWLYDPAANEQTWRNIGRLLGPGRIRPSLMVADGGLYCAGGWLAVTATRGTVVHLPLGSVWQVMPRASFRQVLDKGIALGTPLAGPGRSDGTLLWQCPAVSEVTSLNDVLLRRYALRSEVFRFTPGSPAP